MSKNRRISVAWFALAAAALLAFAAWQALRLRSPHLPPDPVTASKSVSSNGTARLTPGSERFVDEEEVLALRAGRTRSQLAPGDAGGVVPTEGAAEASNVTRGDAEPSGAFEGEFTVLEEDCGIGESIPCRAEGMMVNGYKEGLWRQYDPDGNLWFEHTFKRGKLHGPSIAWSPDGWMMTRTEYRGGKVYGKCEAWYENGQKFSEFTMIHGKRQEVERLWHEDGRLQSEVTYEDNKRQGRCIWYLPDGRVDVEKSGYFESGVKVRDLE